MAQDDEKLWVERLEDEVERVVKAMPEYEKILGMYKEMLIAEHEAKSSIAAVEVDMDAKRAAVCIQAGKTLLGEIDAKFDAEAARALFDKLKEIAGRHGEEFAKESEKIDEAAKLGELDIAAVLEEAFAGGSVRSVKKKARELELDAEFLAYLVFSSVRANLEAYAEKLRPMIDEDDWERKHCPVCGRLPFMSSLEGEGGKRVLCCPGCSAAWRYPRIKCVNCANQDHEKLRLLFPEDGSRERCAEVCDKCKRYLKMIDVRKLAQAPVMQLVDAATLHIDVLAQREGYVVL